MSKQPNSNGLLIAALFQSRGVLATLIVSQVIAILLAFSPMSLGDVWLRLAIFSCFLHLVFLSSLSLLYVCRALLTKLSHSKQLFILISTLLALTSVFSWLFLFVFSDVFAMESRANFIVSNLLIIFLVTALFSQFLLIHNQKEQQTKALAQAELDALQARIRPHFCLIV